MFKEPISVVKEEATIPEEVLGMLEGFKELTVDELPNSCLLCEINAS